MTRSILTACALAGFPALAAAAGTPEAAPVVSTAGSLIQVFIGLVAVLFLIAGAAWIARRLGVTQMGASNLLRVVSTASVGTRERVVVVEIGESWLVVGVAPGSVTALTTLPKGELPSHAHPVLPGSFGLRLQQLIEKRRGK